VIGPGQVRHEGRVSGRAGGTHPPCLRLESLTDSGHLWGTRGHETTIDDGKRPQPWGRRKTGSDLGKEGPPMSARMVWWRVGLYAGFCAGGS
jgi:hypothetical protein